VESVKSLGQICILDIDVQGVMNVKKSSLEAYFIFIAPPSMEELESRLRRRGTESEDDIKERLENSAQELVYGREEGNFDLFLVNDDLNRACLSLIEKVKGWYPHIKDSADHHIQSNHVSTCVSLMKQLGNLCY